MTDSTENVTHGKAEIWRREKLVMLSALVTLPFGVCFLLTPVLAQPWQTAVVAGFLISAACSGALGVYWAGSTCPVCGRRIGGQYFRPLWHRCVSCGLSVKPEKPVNYAISFHSVAYQSGDKEENVEPESGHVRK